MSKKIDKVNGEGVYIGRECNVINEEGYRSSYYSCKVKKGYFLIYYRSSRVNHGNSHGVKVTIRIIKIYASIYEMSNAVLGKPV